MRRYPRSGASTGASGSCCAGTAAGISSRRGRWRAGWSSPATPRPWPSSTWTTTAGRTFSSPATTARHSPSTTAACRAPSLAVSLRGRRQPDGGRRKDHGQLPDGSTQTAEVSRGSGYYSQSVVPLFFRYPKAVRQRSCACAGRRGRRRGTRSRRARPTWSSRRPDAARGPPAWPGKTFLDYPDEDLSDGRP